MNAADCRIRIVYRAYVHKYYASDKSDRLNFTNIKVKKARDTNQIVLEEKISLDVEKRVDKEIAGEKYLQKVFRTSKSETLRLLPIALTRFQGVQKKI